ncbi:outer membrane protein TolC [Parabacteroides sp. PF5-5]|uniref:TolC family protein n=1 Tax=unclassified Parabacteroides TaxID=2649774 RepID=UPI0024739D71|nr:MULTISPECIES: TolC family protein [unclassified Parabacteroides]MDH6305120.1 outer membrane protein TolC [Parabacteroides sp. PH5-39]MDH6316470.1 outer membrane protein TolC [Parabacteroides sp. PF5-13]MDH6319980.1 outer membrane protein TolC [Parabacteroides sp. PH5-13]MDH6323787.1 outer membrane protein TolC [Parabacteroides sp. PH5-8]MDH6327657.1 outer membrane protein TolC [Parabacteroides sp. PH5-41]
MKQLIVLFALLLAVNYTHAQRTLTLEECRNLAIQNNKELQISNQKIKAADYEKKAAFTKYFPELSATGAYLWNQKDLRIIDLSGLGSIGEIVGTIAPGLKDIGHLDIQNVWVGAVSLVQPVFLGGKIINYNQITKYAKELAESMNNQKLQDVIYQIDETYWQVVSLVNKKELADAYVSLLQKMNRDVTEMINEGLATQADGLSVKVKLNEAEMAQTKVDNGLALSRMLLAQLCGLPIHEPLALADENIKNISVGQSRISADVNEAFMNRQELKSLDLASKIYQKKESIVLADMLPNVALTANYLITNPNSFNGFKNEFGGMFNVGVMLKVPLSGWWEGSYKRNSARAETLISRLEFEEAREKIELQVNQSVYKVNEAQKKLIASSRHMESAEENLRHANFGFEEGVIPPLNLMEAQTAWLSAHSDMIDAQIDVKLTEVYLTKALGKLRPQEHE